MSVQSEIERIKAGKEDIRAAIAEKGQSVPATALLSSYGDKIRAIQTGTDTSDATAAAGDILSGKTAYVNGEQVTGTIASKTASDLTASGPSIIVPAGYYPSQASKSVASATQATPSITVSSAGLITASAAQAAGYVASGTKSATQQLTTQAAQDITPGTYDKTIASGRYLTGAQTIKGDANLLAANIKNGVSIFGVQGTLQYLERTTLEITRSITASKVCVYYCDTPSTVDFRTYSASFDKIKLYTYGPVVIIFSKSTTGSVNTVEALNENCVYKKFLYGTTADVSAFLLLPTGANSKFYATITG